MHAACFRWACGRGTQEDMKREAAHMFIIYWWELPGVTEPVRLCSTEHMDLRALHWELHMHRLLLRDHKPQPLSFLQAGCQLDPLQEGLHLSIRNGQLRVPLMGRRRKEGT